MKLKKIISLLALSTGAFLPICNLSIQNNKNSTSIDVVNIRSLAAGYCGGLSAPDPLNDLSLLKTYFAPNYSNSGTEFIPNVEGAGKYFPKLWRFDNNTKELVSITFKQLFITDSIATSIVKSIGLRNINDPVLIFSTSNDGSLKIENRLYQIESLNLASLFLSDSELKNSPEQLLSAIFLNPWLYDTNVIDGEKIVNFSESYSLLDNIELQNNSLTSIPVNTFANIGAKLAQDSDLNIVLNSNNLSYIGKEQFGQNNNIDFTLDIKNNKIDVNTSTSDITSNLSSLYKTVIVLDDNHQQTDFFSPIDENNDFFLYDLIHSNFNSHFLWPSLLLKDNVVNIIAAEIDKLNLYQAKLEKSAELSKIITIDDNDWTGKFNITIHSKECLTGENGDLDYNKNMSLNQKLIPLLISCIVLIFGITFLGSRIKNILGNKKNSK